MKKSISAFAMMASASSAMAIVAPNSPSAPRPQQPKTYCLSMYQNSDGSTIVGSCDESRTNQAYNLPLNENGCADNQAAFTSVKSKIAACPAFVQL